MTAPQYPKGLAVYVCVNQLDGDVCEVDAVNHDLGMPPLDEGGQSSAARSSLSPFRFLAPA